MGASSLAPEIQQQIDEVLAGRSTTLSLETYESDELTGCRRRFGNSQVFGPSIWAARYQETPILAG